tara:strand:+ start:406 stop:666 length:261 start_codon:yes stop_codon:yes gene_type:complete
MEQVIRLLKGRKAAAKLELSHCEEGNKHYDKVRKERTEEIKQLDKSLLILSSVVVPKGTLTMCHARTGKECIKPTSCQAFGCNKQM